MTEVASSGIEDPRFSRSGTRNVSEANASGAKIQRLSWRDLDPSPTFRGVFVVGRPIAFRGA